MRKILKIEDQFGLRRLSTSVLDIFVRIIWSEIVRDDNPLKPDPVAPFNQVGKWSSHSKKVFNNNIQFKDFLINWYVIFKI